MGYGSDDISFKQAVLWLWLLVFFPFQPRLEWQTALTQRPRSSRHRPRLLPPRRSPRKESWPEAERSPSWERENRRRRRWSRETRPRDSASAGSSPICFRRSRSRRLLYVEVGGKERIAAPTSFVHCSVKKNDKSSENFWMRFDEFIARPNLPMQLNLRTVCRSTNLSPRRPCGNASIIFASFFLVISKPLLKKKLLFCKATTTHSLRTKFLGH